MTKRNTFSKVLSLPLLLALLVLVSMVWIQASVSPAAAQEPVQDLSEVGMRVEIIPEEIHTLAIGTTPVFYVGDVFSVSIIAENVEEPGIFGSQFSIFLVAAFCTSTPPQTSTTSSRESSPRSSSRLNEVPAEHWAVSPPSPTSFQV